MEQESWLGTDAPGKKVPMSPRTTEERTLLAVRGNQRDGWSVHEKLFGAEENTPRRRRA